MNQETVKLGDIVKCADMKMRRCTHFLDKGVVPLGKQQKMGRGRHRGFDLGQAFDLILAYRLSELRVPCQKLKEIISVVHENFDELKWPVSDGFFPPRGQFDSKFDWCLVISRGEWIVIVPEKYVADWLDGDGACYSLRRLKSERSAGIKLSLCWLEVPLRPIAECVRLLDPRFDETYYKLGVRLPGIT